MNSMREKIIFIMLSFFFTFQCLGQDEHELFRATFFRRFFNSSIDNFQGISLKNVESKIYFGKKLSQPRYYELYGTSERELRRVNFQCKLKNKVKPIQREVLKTYCLYIRNDSKYSSWFDTTIGDWKDEYYDTLNALINSEILASSKEENNLVKIILNRKTNKYYIISNNYCALLKIRVHKFRNWIFMKRYGYSFDKESIAVSVMNSMQLCDYAPENFDNVLDLDVNCFNLYSITKE